MKVYANNAATSFPKPPSVVQAMTNCLTHMSSNPGRSASFKNLEGSRLIFDCRNNLCDLFHYDKPENVIFTSNITSSLNMLINGCVQNGWHVVTTTMEHNSVLRPLHALSANRIIDLDVLECDKNGSITVDEIKKSVKSDTKLIVISHSSNIIGTIQPIYEIGEFCRENSINLIIDGAQSAGVLDIDLSKQFFSAFCFTGHKSLLGPQGIGGFVISDDFNEIVSPTILGGTGSASSEILQPLFLPDKFESGTMNTPGIAGLNEGVKFILQEGIHNIRKHELELNDKLISEIQNIDDLILYGYSDSKLRTSAVSVNSKKIDNSAFSFQLDSEFGILTRSGLHCAPLAHETIGTYPSGTLRLSFGYYSTSEDIRYCLDSIIRIHKNI